MPIPKAVRLTRNGLCLGLPPLPRPRLDPNLIKSLNRIEQLYKAPFASAPLSHPLRHQMRPIKAHIKQKITSASCRPIAIYSSHTHTHNEYCIHLYTQCSGNYCGYYLNVAGNKLNNFKGYKLKAFSVNLTSFCRQSFEAWRKVFFYFVGCVEKE